MWRASESAAEGTLTFSHRKLSSLCQCSRSKRSYTAPENNHRWQVSPVSLKLQMYLPEEATRYWKQTYQEDQTVQEQSVEESNGPGHLVGENHTSLRDANNRSVRWEVHTDTQKTRVWCLIQILTRPRVALSQGLRLRYRRWRSWKHTAQNYDDISWQHVWI